MDNSIFKTKAILLQPITEELTPRPLLSQIREAYHKDPTLLPIIEHLSTTEPTEMETEEDYTLADGLLLFQGRIAVPSDDEIQRDILIQCHDDPTAGHFGIHKTFELVNCSFHWPGLRPFVHKFVTTCDICQRNKTP